MRTSIVLSFTIFGLLGNLWMQPANAQNSQSTMPAPAQASPTGWKFQDSEPFFQTSSLNSQTNQDTQDAIAGRVQDAMANGQASQPSGQDAQASTRFVQGPGFTSSVVDPVVNLQHIRLTREQAKTPGDALFKTSPLTPLRERFIATEKRIFEHRDIKYGANLNTLFQGLTDNIDGTDDFGMTSFLAINGTWDGFRKGCPNQGELTIGIEGRWNWGTTEVLTLGAVGLGSSGFTANPFGIYTPTFLVRNLFWRQGSREAGWMYRIGRVTPDQFLQTSQHVTPLLHNLPIIGTGPFAMGLPDSGIGMFGGFFINDNVNIAGVVSDANANRANFGDLGEGDLFTAVELQAKIRPFTKNAGYSKLTFWHNDGTDDGNPLNGSTGAEGWGFFLKGEHELSRDGRIVGLLRYGKSYRDSALYQELATGHFLVYDPFKSGRYKRRGYNADLAGVVARWTQPTGVDRDETNIELFYRFALFPEMQATFSFQGIFNPAQDPTNEYGSAFSFRLRSTW